jgi:hypothetical protein
MSFDEPNNNPATIEIENPQNFKIEREELSGNNAYFTLTLEIPAERLDKLAVAWIKHRAIQA